MVLHVRYNFLVHFLAVFCRTTTWNDQILRLVKNVHHDGELFKFLYGIERVFTYLVEDSSDTDRQTECI